MTNLVPLGEIVDIKGGGTPDKKVPAYWDGDIPWASVKDFKSGVLDRTVDRITTEGVAASATQVIPAGHIIVPTRMAVGKAAINTIDLAINQDLKALFPKPDVDTRYLYHALLGSSDKLLEQATGATVKGIKLEVLRSLEIPLPPLEEQKRIAGILDQAAELCRLRTRALEKLNTLGQAIFHEMFGDPVAHATATLADIVQPGDKINYGVVQPGDDVPDGIPLLRAGDILSPALDPENFRRVSAAVDAKHKKSRLKGDEILVACVGSIGSVALAHGRLKGVNIARAVARVPVDGEKANRVFLASQLKSQAVQNYFQREIRLVAQPTLNIKQITEAPIFLPSLDSQEEFAHRLAQLDDSLASAGIAQLRAEALFASLQHRAFRGDL